MRIFKYFWILLFFYFIFVHPAIIYYGTDFRYVNLSRVDPKESFVYLALSVALWSFIFGFSFYLLMKYSFIKQKNISQIIRNGVRLPARIIEVRPLKSFNKRIELKTISLEFDNLEGERVWQKIDINDSRPQENRFEMGKTLYLRVDENLKRSPFFVLEDIRTKINPIPYIVWIVFLSGVLYYYDYSYDLENAGYGWRFLSFSHPLISSAGFLIFFSGIFYLIFRFLIFKKLNIGKESVILKFRGLKAYAKIIQAEQTGTYINEQPEIQFDIEFTDYTGDMRRTKIRKIVSLVDLASVKLEREKEIFYDKKNPDSIMFEEDINSI